MLLSENILFHREESWLEKPSKEPTYSEYPDEIVSDTDQDQRKWPFLEVPMTEVLDEDESEKNFENNENLHSRIYRV